MKDELPAAVNDKTVRAAATSTPTKARAIEESDSDEVESSLKKPQVGL